MPRYLRLVLVFTVLYGTGAHWAALQTIAWVRMAADGQTAPCGMCRMVDEGASPASAPVVVNSVPHAEFAFASVPEADAVLPRVPIRLQRASFPSSVESKPFVPPPKSVLPV